MLWLLTRDPLYAAESPEMQNILKWTALVHDIRKRGNPVLVGKDHIHPFISAVTILDAFERMGIIPPSEQLREAKTLLNSSVQPH